MALLGARKILLHAGIRSKVLRIPSAAWQYVQAAAWRQTFIDCNELLNQEMAAINFIASQPLQQHWHPGLPDLPLIRFQRHSINQSPDQTSTFASLMFAHVAADHERASKCTSLHVKSFWPCQKSTCLIAIFGISPIKSSLPAASSGFCSSEK